jgi:hypothetical protein
MSGLKFSVRFRAMSMSLQHPWELASPTIRRSASVHSMLILDLMNSRSTRVSPQVPAAQYRHPKGPQCDRPGRSHVQSPKAHSHS